MAESSRPGCPDGRGGHRAYGAGLARYVVGEGVVVVEANRLDCQRRRRRGKSDTVDAEATARAALNAEAAGVPKAGGPVERVRVPRLARRSTIKARTHAANQIRDLIVTASFDPVYGSRHRRLRRGVRPPSSW